MVRSKTHQHLPTNIDHTDSEMSNKPLKQLMKMSRLLKLFIQEILIYNMIFRLNIALHFKII
jgi:hypothetical protein